MTEETSKPGPMEIDDQDLCQASGGLEAASEYVIGAASQLAQGDHKDQLSTAQNALNRLKNQGQGAGLQRFKIC